MKFKANSHQYFNEDDNEYISVSKLSHLLEPKKDWASIKKKFAKKNNLTVEEVSAIWENKKNKGTQAGTIIHEIEEKTLIDNPAPEFFDVICKKQECPFEGEFKYSHPIEKLENNTVYPELIIYDHDIAVCGQADKVVVVNNTLNVFDFKTDETISFEGYSNEWKKPEKYLPPISHLETCNGNMYSIKMSMYMYMLWKLNKNLRVGDLILQQITLKRDEEGIPILSEGIPIILSRKDVKVPYRRTEVKDIFEYYKQGKLTNE